MLGQPGHATSLSETAHMDHAGQRDDASRGQPAGHPARRLVGPLGSLMVLAALSVLAFRLTVEVNDRRGEGFCRPDHGIAGATASEERTWWPLGERCFLRLGDGTTRVREPGWSLTALAAGWSAVVVSGVLSSPGSARRRLAWSVVVPAVPVAVLVVAVVGPRSLSRLVALTSISLGFGSFMGAITAVAVWYVMRGRVMATILGSWLAWAVIIFLQGRDSIGP